MTRPQSCILVSIVLALGVVCARPSAADTVIQGDHYAHTGDIRALVRTGDSLWVGTSGGLFVYDLGMDRMVDRTGIGEHLPSASVRALAVHGDSVFAGTDDGIAVFDGTRVTVHSAEEPGSMRHMALRRIRSIDFGPHGTIYLGTLGEGVDVIDDHAHVLTTADSLLDNKVFGVAEAPDSTVYFATSMGLCAFRDSLWVNFQAGAGIPRGPVRRIVPAPYDMYYLLVSGRGVFQFNGSYAHSLLTPGVFRSNAVADIALDERGTLWAAGRYGGIASYRNGHWDRVEEQDADVAHTPWRCAYADGAGGVFFGSADGLVLFIRDTVARKIRIPGELPSGYVRSLVASPAGDMFFLSGPRVIRMEGTPADDGAPDGLAALACPADSTVWGAGRWGLFRRTAKGWRPFAVDTREPEPAFSALVFDARGSLWTGSRSGNVYRFDGELWERMGEGTELAPKPPSRMVAGEGGLWVLYPDSVVARFDGAGWHTVGAAAFGGRPAVDLVQAAGVIMAATDRTVWMIRPGTDDWARAVVPGDSTAVTTPKGWKIRCIAWDPRGRLVVGTSEGVGVIGPAGVRWIEPRAGLGGRGVADVMVDPSGALWVGFDSDGATRFPRESGW